MSRYGVYLARKLVGKTCTCGELYTEEPTDECEEPDGHFDPCDVFSDPRDGDDFAIDFADPGGKSALRAETPENPRNLPCPTCKAPNRLTPADRACGYQCDSCADRAEMGLDGY